MSSDEVRLGMNQWDGINEFPVDGKGNERPPPGLGSPFDILLCHP